MNISGALRGGDEKKLTTAQQIVQRVVNTLEGLIPGGGGQVKGYYGYFDWGLRRIAPRTAEELRQLIGYDPNEQSFGVKIVPPDDPALNVPPEGRHSPAERTDP